MLYVSSIWIRRLSSAASITNYKPLLQLILYEFLAACRPSVNFNKNKDCKRCCCSVGGGGRGYYDIEKNIIH